MNCPACGQPLTKFGTNCPNCGTFVPDPYAISFEDYKKLIALIIFIIMLLLLTLMG